MHCIRCGYTDLLARRVDCAWCGSFAVEHIPAVRSVRQALLSRKGNLSTRYTQATVAAKPADPGLDGNGRRHVPEAERRAS